MKILRLAAAASMAIAVTLLSSGSAQAYPDIPNVTITISDSVIYGGDTFDYTAKADVECDWTVTYTDGRASGESATQTGSGTSISGTYDTKVVSKTFKSPIKASCKYDDNVPAVSAEIVGSHDVSPAFYSADSGSVLQAATQSASASAVVTLLPRNASGDDDNGVLPNTGGSNLWILVLGGVLLVAGGGVLLATRRRQNPTH